jgi:general stress protein 26
MAPKHDKDRDQKKIDELIHGIRTAMLTTLDEEGRMHSRPMANIERTFDGTLYFFTRRSAPKIDEIHKDQRVNVTFADPSNDRYVSIAGNATVVRDVPLARELWSPALNPWFPGGPDDRDLALLKIDVTTAEYWDVTVNRMVQLYEYIKAAVTGDRLEGRELGDHKKIDLSKH